MVENTKATPQEEQVDTQEIMDTLQELPEAERQKIKYIIKGAALVAEKPEKRVV